MSYLVNVTSMSAAYLMTFVHNDEKGALNTCHWIHDRISHLGITRKEYRVTVFCFNELVFVYSDSSTCCSPFLSVSYFNCFP